MRNEILINQIKANMLPLFCHFHATLVACCSLHRFFYLIMGVFLWTFASAAYQQAPTDDCLYLKDASRRKMQQQQRDGEALAYLAVSVSPLVMAVEQTLVFDIKKYLPRTAFRA